MTVDVQTFTGSNGSGAPTGWSAYSGGGSQSIQSNQWSMTSGGFYVGNALTKTTSYTDIDFTVKLTTPSAGTDRLVNYPAIGIRMSGGNNGWADTYAEGYNGYFFVWGQPDNAVYLEQRTAGSLDTSSTTAVSSALGSASNIVIMRLQAIGTAVKAKIWDADDTEPGSWTAESTLSGYSSGYVGFRQQSLSTGTTTWDDATTDDFVSGSVGRPFARNGVPRAILSR